MFPHIDVKFNHNLKHPKKTCFLYFLSFRLQVQEVIKPGSKHRVHLLCTNNHGLPQIMSWGSSKFLTWVSITLHCVNLLPEMGGRDEAWQSVGFMCMFTWMFWQKQLKECLLTATLAMNTLGEDSFFLFPCQMKHRAPSLEGKKKKKTKPKTNNSEWSTSGDDQHTARDREVAFPWWQLRADSDDFNTPSSAKGTHILSVYKSYSGVQAWESLLQI